MVKVEIIESSVEKTGVSVELDGNLLKCTVEAISIVKALYDALKNAPGGEVFAQIYCTALHEDLFKDDVELKEATRKAEEQTDEANNFLREFMDALKR